MRFLKWAGIGLGGLIAVMLLAIGVVFWRSNAILHHQWPVPAMRNMPIPTDSVAVARGRHLVNVVGGCLECHGERLEGKLVFNDPAIGRLYGRNLTSGRGGFPADYSLVDFDRAVRHGIGRDGTALWEMPCMHYCYLSDADLAAMFAYLKTLPRVDNEIPPRKLGPVGRMLLLQDKFALQFARLTDHELLRRASPEPAPTLQYGEYLARVSCVGCHGPKLSGGPILDAPPPWPPASNLTKGGIGAQYTEADFFKALREGKRPGGGALSEVMPSRYFKNMTDDELHALWLYCQSVPPAPYGTGAADWMATLNQ